MDLSDLKKSVTEMSDEELLQEIKKRRDARRAPAAKRKGAAPASRVNLTDMVAQLDTEGLLAMQAILEEALGGDE